jgi:DNA mismatch repair protein MutL
VGKISLIRGYERIAAGEVIERPASVVKELLENSVDAGAEHISIFVKQAGQGLIQIVDDGHGIEPDDIGVAFQQHTSSKVQCAEDLDHDTTLGFRGEALASVAAISKVELTSRARGVDVAKTIRIEGGNIRAIDTTGAPVGTNIKIMDLFFNTPVRKKFLKSDQVEFGHIQTLVEHYALAYPEIHWKLVHNGLTVLNSPRADTILGPILNIYGRGLVEQLVPVQCSDALLQLTGYLAIPEAARSKKSDAVLFVNRRYVVNHTIADIVRDAFGALIPHGRHPFFILLLAVDPAFTDFNIHPTKKEVRFGNEDLLMVRLKEYFTSFVASQFRADEVLPHPESPDADVPAVMNVRGFRAVEQEHLERPDLDELEAIFTELDEGAIESRAWVPSATHSQELAREYPKPAGAPKPGHSSGSRPAGSRQISSEPSSPRERGAQTNFKSIVQPKGPAGPRVMRFENLPPSSVLPNSGIVADAPNPENLGAESGFSLDDQYLLRRAADGRLMLIHLGRLVAAVLKLDLGAFFAGPPEVRSLVLPATFDLPLAEAEKAREQLECLGALGFQVDLFSGTTFVVRTVPAFIPDHASLEMIGHIVRDLLRGNKIFEAEAYRATSLDLLAKHPLLLQLIPGPALDDTERLLARLDESPEPEHHDGMPIWRVLEKGDLNRLLG